jgi:hypothetical protein
MSHFPVATRPAARPESWEALIVPDGSGGVRDEIREAPVLACRWG